jgi:hypothetical protein
MGVSLTKSDSSYVIGAELWVGAYQLVGGLAYPAADTTSPMQESPRKAVNTALLRHQQVKAAIKLPAGNH